MQLDNTLIAVRSRTNTDILDLSIVLCRRYWPRYTLLALIGWLPWLILDAVILLPITGLRIESTESLVMYTQDSLYARFVYLELLLFVFQLPAASLPLTFYLGQQMFHMRPTWKEMLNNFFGNGGLKLLSLGIIRGIIPICVIVGILTYSEDMVPIFEVFVFPFFICGLFLIPRVLRPFVAEVIVLEQYMPARGKNSADSGKREKGLSYSKRMKALHELVASEMIGRFIYVTGVAGVLLVIAVVSEMWFFQFFYSESNWTWIHCCVLIPINMLFLSVFTTVFRFVSYIDTRILLEGWEVRLRLMSEADRLRQE